jgi:TolA-binding protein
MAFTAVLAAQATSSALAADPNKVIDSFVQAIQNDKDLDDAKRGAVLSLVETQRADAENRQSTITDALSTLNADFRAALALLGDEKPREAAAALEKIAGSADSHLAAEASYFLARAYMMDERFEEAAPLLTKLTGELADKTLYSGEARFLLGSSQIRLLEREAAMATLKKFLDENPDAPERLRVGAERQLAELAALKDGAGALEDVEDRMDFSRRKLHLEDSGDRTRTEQDNIIAMLDKLIEEAEDKEGGS